MISASRAIPGNSFYRGRSERSRLVATGSFRQGWKRPPCGNTWTAAYWLSLPEFGRWRTAWLTTRSARSTCAKRSRTEPTTSSWAGRSATLPTLAPPPSRFSARSPIPLPAEASARPADTPASISRHWTARPSDERGGLTWRGQAPWPIPRASACRWGPWGWPRRSLRYGVLCTERAARRRNHPALVASGRRPL